MSNRKRKQIQDLQLPNINGLTEDVVHTLNHSIADIVRMRRSIEYSDNAVERSMLTIFECCELLKRVRYSS
jgi:S-ribosylhomocysteine lyase LuxS involved in autoinducer biosynthesis